MTASKLARTLLLILAAAPVVACSQSAEGDDQEQGEEDELTSQSALARQLTFQGKVYVRKDASDSEIESAVLTQTQSAFGPLRTVDIAVNNRELKPSGAELDAFKGTFKKRVVTVIDPAVTVERGTEMTEVLYTYKDNAVVAKSYARRTQVPLAVLNPGYRSQTDRVIRECTPNDQHSRDFASSAWYVFEPKLGSCRQAMSAESATVLADRAKLRDGVNQVTKSEVDRLYIPVTAALGADKTNRGVSYPDYQRLYAGGVEPGKLVISLVYGMLDHDHAGGPETDYGYSQYMANLREVFNENPGLRIAGSEPAADFSQIKLASGKVVPLTLSDIIATGEDSGPRGLSYTEQQEAKKLVGQLVYKKFVTYEVPVNVKIGADAEKPVTIKILGYYGAESDSAPHKFAIKHSDVFLYNGHSSIGYGPLDPSRFRKEDFPASYQILFVDGCVSYNYYEKDYIPLKEGGTKNMDLITNGIEAPAYRSGYALGRFVATLINGRQASYKELLQSAAATDSLRVVDGELDNTYTPARFPITVRK